MYEKLCITVKLFHCTSKLGSVDIYHVIYLDPLYLAIEKLLGEEGGGGKILFQAIKLPESSTFAAKRIWGSYFLVRILIQ